METILYTVLFAPLVGSLFGIPFASKQKFIGVGIFASLMLGVSFLASLLLFIHTMQGGVVKAVLMDWIGAGGLYIPFGFLVDSVSATMIFVVTLVSLCVHIYSIGYMSHDKSFNRFFIYLSAFVFSMLILVMSDNFAGLFIGWEGVGLCSWMLIGFWYERDSASFAANEAFIMNRIADLGMLLGIFLVYWTFGSLNYEEVLSNVYEAPKGILVAIGILLFVAIFLINNTVTIGIAVRKEEIAIMKLIGATDFFVRAPFIVEGILIGLIGAALPLTAFYFLYKQVIQVIEEKFSVLSGILQFLPAGELYRILLPVGLILGIGIGFLGSFITIRKHLKV